MDDSTADDLVGGLSISIDARDAYYLALANSGVALIRQVEVVNHSVDPQHHPELTIRLDFDAPTAGLFEAVEVMVQTPVQGESFSLHHFDLEPNLGRLARVDEEQRGRIAAEVLVAGKRAASATTSVEVMAYDQWLARSDHFDSLAAFVLPNHPAVASVLRRASEILLGATGSGDLQGYQDGPERVDQIARAVYDALCELELGYINPPAGIFGVGQKIRTPGRVVEERQGTCIDLAALVASCLAQAGIDVAIMLPSGHAMPAYFRSPLPPQGLAVARDQNAIDQLVAGGQLVPIEAVCVTDRASSFADACAVARPTASELDATVLVKDARLLGVRPLPHLRTEDDGSIVIVQDAGPGEFAPTTVSAESSGVDTGAPDGAEATRLEREVVPGRVQRWLSSLLDLTYRNPLLNMRIKGPGQRGGSGALALGVPSESLAGLEDRLSAGDRIPVRSPTSIPASIRERGGLDRELAAYFDQHPAVYWPGPEVLQAYVRSAGEQLPPEIEGARRETRAADLGADAVDALSLSALRGLRSRARIVEQQTGANNLFLAIGTLRWKDPKRAESLRSPIFLWPVRLEGTRHGEFSIVLDDEAPVTPNYCLIEKLRDVHGLSVPDLEVPPLDDSGIDLNSAIRAVRADLSSAGVPDISVEETAHLAMFNFTSFRLWKDMKDHWQEFLENDVVDHLVHRPGEDLVVATRDSDQGPPEVLCPIPVDESQRAAVQAAVSGESFVLEGPPGTGKSQTIANLLACAIAAGKSVLFVAEKQTALTVVRKRMAEIGLDSFCLDLHDRGSTPEQIRAQLQLAMDSRPTGSVEEWRRLERRQNARADQLQTYRDAVHSSGPSGMSAWRAWQETLSLGDGPAVEVSREFVKRETDDVAMVEELLLELPHVARAADLRPGHPWALSDADRFDSVDRNELARTVEELADCVDALESAPESSRVLGRVDCDVARTLRAAAGALTHPVALDESTVRSTASRQWRDRADELLETFRQHAEKMSGLLGDDAVRIVPDLERLEPLALALIDAGFLGRRKARKQFASALHALDVNEDEPVGRAEAVRDAAAEARQLRNTIDSWNELSGLRLDHDWTPVVSNDVVLAEKQVSLLTELSSLLREHGDGPIELLLAAMPVSAEMESNWTRLRDGWDWMCEHLSVNADSERLWLDGDAFGPRIGAAVSAWRIDADDDRFLQLQRWMTLLGHLEPLGDLGLDGVRTSVLAGRVGVDEASDAFLRGLASAVRRERFESGSLDRFEAQAHDRLVASFVAGENEKRQLMRGYISHRLLEGRPFSPGDRVGRYGRLESDLARKRNRPSVRALFERYGDIIPVLTPCFMMSPDSVARFLPPGKIHFDLVVFDEASQIEVAWAVGAMGRADSVVVVGDSQQMPPSRFGGAGAGDDEFVSDDEDVVEDLESILSECVESRLPRRWLSCHYRSRDESLIAFSNLEFYDRKLTTFPTPTSGQLGVRWHRVDGVFDRSGKGDSLRTNRVEAEAIVAEITKRLNAPASANASIAVVTLNVQQMRLIEELLSSSEDDAVQAALADESDDGLIVRNLESVQGDERDVVMLSVAFSANPSTGKFPLNFGPLNRKGGERRLNVAVTRAREEVLVFCSFEPEDLQLPDTVSRGLRCLRDYLLLARDGVERSGDVLARRVEEVDRHRAEIAEALRAEGLVVAEDLGLSDFRVDLAVRRPEDTGWRAAVLLDGPRWAERSRPEDRDVLPSVALSEAMQWPVVARIWLPAWVDEREDVLDRLVEMLDNPSPTVGIDEPPESTVPFVDDPTPSAAERGSSSLPPPPERLASSLPPPPDGGVSRIEQFAPADLPSMGTMESFDGLSPAEQRRVVRDLASRVLKMEGPTRRGRLLRLVASSYGFTRLRGSREEALAAMLPQGTMQAFRDDWFIWPPGIDPSTWRLIRRTPPDGDRSISDVPPEEIVNVVGHFAEIGMGITEEEAHAHLKDVFDFRRMTENVSELVMEALRQGTADGVLEYRDGHFHTGHAW